MGRILDELFYLRRGERRALAIVTLFLAGSMVLRLTIPETAVKTPEPDSLFLVQMEDLKGQLAILAEEQLKSEESVKNDDSDHETLNLFTFDPNTISEDSLELLGIPARIRSNLLKYREVGGRVEVPEAIAKIYGMDSVLMEQLLPYISIDRIADEHTVASIPSFPIIEEQLELNTSDTLALRSIRGIGISYSRRICRYREMLGGFHSMEQLWEVYGMDSSRYLALTERCTIDIEKVRKIPLNTASFRDLLSHPYIDKSTTYSILQFREFNEGIGDPEQLLENQIIDPEIFRKVKAYLSAD